MQERELTFNTQIIYSRSYSRVNSKSYWLKNGVLDGCRTISYKWMGLDWMVSGWGRVLRTFNSANKEI